MERSNNEIIKSLNKIRTELQCMKGVENELASTLKDISEGLGNAENSMNHLFTTLKRGYDGIEDCLQGMIDQTDYLLDLIVKGQLDANRHDIDNLKELLEDELDKVKGGNESLGNIRDFIGNIDNTVLPNLGLSSNYTAPFAAGVECVLNGIDTLKSELNGQLDESNDRTEDPNNIYSQTKVKVNNETLTENDAIQSLDLELSDIQAIRVHVDEVESLLIEIREILKDIYARLGITNQLLGTIILRIEDTNDKLDGLAILFGDLISETEATNAKLDTLNNGIATINTKLDTIDSGIATNNTKLDTLSNDIVTNNTKLDTLINAINTNNSKLDQIITNTTP